jgi:hypothetical protein
MARSQHNFDHGKFRSNNAGERYAVHGAGHLNVAEYESYIDGIAKQVQCFVCVRRLDDCIKRSP